MKMKRILFAVLCAVFALSCQKDEVEDVQFGPEGQTYFDLSFNASGLADGTKVGLDPTGTNGYLYWTNTETITLYDADDDYESYATRYVAPTGDSALASFTVSGFQVAAGEDEINILATSGSVSAPTTAGVYTVTVPTLALTSTAGVYNYDTFAKDLPFISPTETAGVTTTSGGSTSYSGDAPTLSMLPVFNTLRLSMANIDTSYTTAEVKYITAKVTIAGGTSAYFYDSIDVTASTLAYESDVNTAVSGASTGTASNVTSITSSVTYDSAVSLASLKNLMIPLVSLGTSASYTSLTVEVNFYTAAEGTLVASASETFNGYKALEYGVVNKVDIAEGSFEYDKNKVEAVSGLSLSSTGVASPEITVSWTTPSVTTNTDTYSIYYAVVDGEVGAYTEVPNVTSPYVLGKDNEDLAWGKTYSIYVESNADAGYKDAQCEASQVAVGAEVDIAQSSTGEGNYDIYTLAGLKAFASIVKGGDATTTATISGFTWSSTGDYNANATLMASITLDNNVQIGVAGSVTYQGTFDGGSSSGFEVTYASGASAPLFAAVEGATIQNLTISGAVTSTTVTGGIVGAIASGSVATTFNNVISSVIVKIGEAGSEVVSNYAYGFVGTIDSYTTVTFTDCQDTKLSEDTFSSSDLAAVTVTSVAQNTAGTEIVVTWGIPSSTNKYDYVVVTYTPDEGSASTTTPVLASAGTVSFDAITGTEYTVKVATVNVAGSTASEDSGNASSWTVTPEAPSYDIVLTTTDDSYEIYTAKGLQAFAQLVNGTTTEITGLSTNSVNATTETFPTFTETPKTSINGTVMISITITDGTTPMVDYAGTFDGGNGLSATSATGIKISNRAGSQGLFASLADGASVSNVTLENSVISNSTESATVGAIAGTTVSGSSISYCTVTGGSVTVSDTDAVAGALVGDNKGTITNSTSSCLVTVNSIPQNGGSLSCLVGSGSTVAAGTGCSDDYTGYGFGDAAATATIASAVPEYSDVSVTLTYTANGSGVVLAKLYVKEGTGDYTLSDKVLTLGESQTVKLTGLTADTEYSFYISTYNVYGAETKMDAGDYATATTFDSSTYSGVTIPAISASTDGAADDNIVFTWTAPTVDDGYAYDLQKIVITYNSDTETITRTDILAGTYTMTSAYDTAETTFNYTCYYAPSALTTTMVEKNPSEAVTISINSYDIAYNENGGDGYYEIYNAAGLQAFASIVNGYTEETKPTAKGVTWNEDGAAADSDANAVVMGDISLSGVADWEVYAMTAYAGTFDGGNGASQSLLTGVTSSTQYAITDVTSTSGFFKSTTADAVIQNLSLTAAVSPELSNVGILIGEEDVTGTAAGKVSYCRIYGSLTASGDYTSSINNLGAVAGSSNGITVEYTNNYADVIGGTSTNAHSVGFVSTGDAQNTIKNCENHGYIYGYGAAGFTGYSATGFVISDCKNYGYIYAKTKEGGGFVTSANGTSSLTNCTNYGTVYSGGSGLAGGLIGTAGGTVTITSCSNEAIVNSAGSSVGGLVGSTNGNIVFAGTGSNSGKVNSSNSEATGVGGLVGNLASGATISGYTNSGVVTIGGTFSDSSTTANSSDDTITDGTVYNILYGVVGSGSAGTSSGSSDSSVSTPEAITITKFELQDGSDTTYDVEWTYGTNGGSDVANVVFYTTDESGSNPSTFATVVVNGSSSVASTTLTFSVGTTYIVAKAENFAGSADAISSGLSASTVDGSNELSATNPFAVTIEGEAVVDMIYDSETTTYSIYTAEGLKTFAAIVNGDGSTGAGIYNTDDLDDFDWTDSDNQSILNGVKSTYSWVNSAAANGTVCDDIDLSSVCSASNGNWTPIGKTSYKYSGTFDGGSDNGYEIQNLYTSSGAQYFGLFGYAYYTSTIENVKLTGVDITAGGTHVAALVGYSEGLWSGGINSSAYDYDAFQTYAVNISNCSVSGSVDADSNKNVGVIVGYGTNAVFVEDTETNVTMSNVTYGGAFMGGCGSNTPIYMLDCVNSGAISGDTYIGGFVGDAPLNANAKMYNCVNNGRITGTSTRIGGILGSLSNAAATLYNCSNNATVTAGSTGNAVGGIIGYTNVAATLYGCSTGESSAISGQYYLGGIVGQGAASDLTIDGACSYGDGDGSVSISTSETKGTVKADSNTGTDNGAIIGTATATTTISNYTNTCVVYSSSNVVQNTNGVTSGYCLVGYKSIANVTFSNCVDNYTSGD